MRTSAWGGQWAALVLVLLSGTWTGCHTAGLEPGGVESAVERAAAGKAGLSPMPAQPRTLYGSASAPEEVATAPRPRVAAHLHEADVSAALAEGDALGRMRRSPIWSPDVLLVGGPSPQDGEGAAPEAPDVSPPALNGTTPSTPGAPSTGAPPVQTLPPLYVEGRRVPTPTFRQGTGLSPHASLGTRVGPNRQPVWTTQRRFATTRAYVLAPWQVEFESWWIGEFGRDDEQEHTFQQEIMIGFPGRFQLDLYWNVIHETEEDETVWKNFQVEGRWALAPWNCLPLNPTLYAEYKFNEDAPDVLEGKLLLATEIGCRAHYAINFFAERELGGEKEEEFGFSHGISYALIDPTLSVGVEMLVEMATEEGSRDDPEYEVLLGPSFQLRPIKDVHIDIAPLFGLTDDSPVAEVFVTVGIDIFPGTSEQLARAPTSTRSR